MDLSKKQPGLIVLALFMLMFLLNVASVKACLHFTETFTGNTFPTAYGNGNATLTTGVWEYQQARQELASNSYGGVGGAVRLAKNVANVYLISPAVNSIGAVSFYYRGLNTGSGTFKVQKSINGGAFTDIATQIFNSQTFSLFSFTLNDMSNNIRIRILSDNSAENLIIDEVNITNYDITPPTVSAIAQVVTNTGQSALVQSSEGEGFVYIIKDGVPQSNYADLENAVANLQGAKAAITNANTNVNVSAMNLQIGNYYAYAVDCAHNKSAKGNNLIQVVVSTASISGVSFANGSYKIGSAITATITADGTGYTAGTITINGQAVSGFTDLGNNTYTVIYTVGEGNPDRSSAAAVPISIVLLHSGNPSNTFTGPATGSITIDANRPFFSSSLRVSDVQIKLTANENLNASTLSQSNAAGFIILDQNNSSLQYPVNSSQNGSVNSELLLNTNSLAASALTGLSIQYTLGGDGILADAAGNLMLSNPAIPAIQPWTGVNIHTQELEATWYCYPNPFTDIVTIVTPEVLKTYSMVIWDGLGNIVYQKENLQSGCESSIINLSNLPSGIYCMQVIADENRKTFRLLKD